MVWWCGLWCGVVGCGVVLFCCSVVVLLCCCVVVLLCCCGVVVLWCCGLWFCVAGYGVVLRVMVLCCGFW